MTTPTDTLADLGRLIANFSDAQDVVTAANERGKEPSNDEYWNRDDAGVAVADQLSLMLELGWTLVPPAPTAEPVGENFDVTLTVEIRVQAETAEQADEKARALLQIDNVDVQDTGHITSYHEHGSVTASITHDYSNEINQ